MKSQQDKWLWETTEFLSKTPKEKESFLLARLYMITPTNQIDRWLVIMYLKETGLLGCGSLQLPFQIAPMRMLMLWKPVIMNML